MPRPTGVSRELSEGLAELQGAKLLNASGAVAQLLEHRTVSGVTHDSKQVLAGDVFFAMPGACVHGAKFAGDAINRGGVAVVTDQLGASHLPAEVISAVPIILCDNPRDGLGPFSAWLYGQPSQSLKVIGITGTNGKTTTAWFVAAAANAAGLKAASLGTTGLQFVGKSWGLGRTTPEASDLQAALALLVELGAEVVAMEVSSHALALGRVNGTYFSTVGFTGLSQDHLDFHEDMHRYFAAKARLFTTQFATKGVVVLDDWGQLLVSQTGLTCETVGLAEGSADWQVTKILADKSGSSLCFTTPEKMELATSLRTWGDFNCLNAVLAVALAYQIGVDAEVSAKAISEVSVPGRMQAIAHSSGIRGVVDYAHTPDAITRAIGSVRALSGVSRVIVVLGAGGDRDSSKRAEMGKAAGLADLIYVTDDNPRSEDPALIRASVLGGLDSIGKGIDSGATKEIPERARAIALAVEAASPDDVVMVLGKGHELGQESGGVIREFDDHAELNEALNRRSDSPGSIEVAS